MNPFSVSPEASPVAAWVGLDWADQQHVICLYEVATGHSAITRLEQKPEALQDWLSQLRHRFGGAPVAIVLEQARGAVISALLSADFVRLYPVNPQSLASYRKAYAPSGAKSDPADAVLLMEMVRKSPERFRVWKPDDADTRSLQLLTENRRQLVNQKTALTNQLTSLLKTYYPQALELAGALDSLQACDFLKTVADAGSLAARSSWPDSPAVPGTWAAQLGATGPAAGTDSSGSAPDDRSGGPAVGIDDGPSAGRTVAAPVGSHRAL